MLITVAGVPAHPLLVHAVVVLIPLAAFVVLAIGAALLGRRAIGSALRVVGSLSAVSGLVAITATVLAGHSGGQAVWGFVTS
ncbi:hypothetical protein [Pseudonocardia sp.]|uniref:hypothetical protein n=1 Tax=Pseudonocardia sp. TaxID=60912 RepID=UPI002D854330|nr:hypothetical protein [Pseudonocardia sp.]